MILDSSAALAIPFREPDAPEACMIAEGRRGAAGAAETWADP